MPLSREDVLHLADLSRLALSEQELASSERDLDRILGYVNRLQNVDTAGVDPSGLAPRAEGWREDVALPCDEAARELIVSNFPEKKGNLLKTPGVFEKPKGKVNSAQ